MRIIIVLLILPVSLFPLNWSKNQVWKIQAVSQSNFSQLDDYEGIQVEKEWIRTDNPESGWLETEPVELGEDYVIDNAFVNFKSRETNQGVLLMLKNAQNGETIKEQWFTRSGRMDLLNVFQKELKLVVELKGPDVKLFSFGLVRKQEIVMTHDEVIVLPDLLFYNEENLKIDFNLRFPAILDVVLFNKNGRIIDYVARRAFFREGENTLYWEPETSSTGELISGIHVIYFKVRAIDGKQVEITKPFLFIHH